MTRTCDLIIHDYTNCLFTGLDEKTASACKNLYTFWAPSYWHSPKYKLGRWDGKISIWKKGWIHNNLIGHEVLDIIQRAGYDVRLDDRRVFPDITLEPVTTESVFGGVTLRDYQVDAVNAVVNAVNCRDDSWGCGLLKMATGAGKSYVCGVISSMFAKYGRVLVIVPNVGLVVQTAKSFRDAGITDVGEFSGEKKIVHNVTVTTWQSLDNYPELLAEVLCVIVDEAHQSKANVLFNMMTGPGAKVPFRFGCTGTLPKDDLAAMQVKSSLGDVLYEMQAWELQQAGVLASCQIEVLQTKENRVFIDHPEEHKWLTSDPDRLQWVADVIRKKAASGNTLVLVKNVKTGKDLAKLIGPDAVFLHGGDKSKVRTAHYESIKELDGKILVCTDGIASTGIDIPRIFNLFIFEIGKSFIKIIQSIGRGLRKAEDKDHVNIYDVCADTKYSTRHLAERKKFYTEARYPYTITKVTYQ